MPKPAITFNLGADNDTPTLILDDPQQSTASVQMSWQELQELYNQIGYVLDSDGIDRFQILLT